MRVHHVGIVTEQIEKSRRIYESLGYKACSDITLDYQQHNKLLFMESSDLSQRIELIESIDDDSTVRNFKPGYHHIGYEVAEPMEVFVKRFHRLRIGKIFSPPIQAPALENRLIRFAFLTTMELIEFIFS